MTATLRVWATSPWWRLATPALYLAAAALHPLLLLAVLALRPPRLTTPARTAASPLARTGRVTPPVPVCSPPRPGRHRTDPTGATYE